MKMNTPQSDMEQTLVQAVQYFSAGLHEKARELCEEMLGKDPQQAEAMGLLGAIAIKTGEPGKAITLLTRAVTIRPANPMLHIELGRAYMAAGKLEEAIQQFKQTITRFPDQAMPYFNLANVLQQTGHMDEAIDSYQKALALQPGLATAWNNLGNAHKKQGDRQQALKCYEQALEHNPKLVQAGLNIGLEYQEQGELDQAISHYTRLLERHPDNAKAHFHRSACYLLKGDFQQGWPEYEWRWRLENIVRKGEIFSQPVWDGTWNKKRRILLYTEQGLGDTFQFVRYIPLLVESGMEVIFECPRLLLRVLKGISEFAQVVPAGEPLPDFDCHTSLMSLPGIMGTQVDSIPSTRPYLRSEPDLIAKWKPRVTVEGEFTVGILWQGSKANKNDLDRSVSLQRFVPFADIPGIRLVSLQKFAGQDQLQALESGSLIEDIGVVIDTGEDGFVETAAVMESLDLIITVDTAAAHVAGALGRPVWVLLPRVPDWRWMMEREDSPWYPSMRLFRQHSIGDWDDVFRRVYAALQVYKS